MTEDLRKKHAPAYVKTTAGAAPKLCHTEPVEGSERRREVVDVGGIKK